MVPYIWRASIALLDTFSFQFFLPETKGQPLPDALPQKQKRDRELQPMVAK